MKKHIVSLLTVVVLLVADTTQAGASEGALTHSNRATEYIMKGHYDKAIAEGTEAIRLDPKNIQSYLNRGSAYVLKGEYDKGIADFDQAIRLDPKDAIAFDNRAAAFAHKGDYQKATEDYQKALRISPKKPEPYAYFADLLATCPKAELRDGQRAVELATKACELTKWNDPISLAALAAASAEIGDFKRAVAWQKKAMESPGFLVIKRKQDLEESRQRLKQYEERKPYRRKTLGSVKPV